ncbi:hypothetical protein [Paenibacillus wenxiniae]|uniref:Uncharacterized protein n=1 Tax=Paenibacillus wenxiniae TaxID=1636843 RepID=A0ABW4RME4_9BACL
MIRATLIGVTLSRAALIRATLIGATLTELHSS